MDMSRRQQIRDTTRYIGRRIKYGRSLRSMSQENLAAALGITFQQVQKYENGVNRVAACTLLAIAGELKVPFSFFLPSEETPSLSEIEISAMRADIAEACGAIDDALAQLTEVRSRLSIGEARLGSSPLTKQKDHEPV